MSNTIVAYFINGPEHGTIKILDEETAKFPYYRVAAPPHWDRPPEEYDIKLKTGRYAKTRSLVYDTISYKLADHQMCWIYEWVGWES